MKQHLVISKKYTGRHHSFFTLWGPNDTGYVYAVETAGLYGENELIDGYHYNKEETTSVELDLVKKHLSKYLVDDYICHVLPITEEVLDIIGITSKELLGKGPVPQHKRMKGVRDLTTTT